MKRYNFNMVEILLAIAIIAVGISGVMGLFSAGIKANAAAVHNNSSPDMLENISSYLKEENIKAATKTGWGSIFNDTNFEDDTGKSVADLFGTIAEDNGNIIVKSTANKSLLYRQLIPVSYKSDGSVEKYSAGFSAVVRLKLLSGSNNYLRKYLLEISYPAEFPKDERELKIVPLEIFNTRYVTDYTPATP